MPDIQLPKTKMTIAEFAAAVKSAHPVYKDIPDNTLYQKMITAYPQYKDKVSNPLSGDADAKTAQDKATAKSQYGSRFLSGVKSTLPSIMAPPDDKNLTDANLTPEKLFAQNKANQDPRPYKQQISDIGEPESLGQIAGAGGQVLAGAGLGMLPVRKLASSGLNMIADVMEHPTTAGKILATPTRGLANYIKPDVPDKFSAASITAPVTTPPPSFTGADPGFKTDPVQAFKYPNKTRAIKNPPSIPNAPVDVPPISPISQSPADIVNSATRAEAATPGNVAKLQALKGSLDPRISNIAPGPNANPLNTAFDPNKLISNPNVPSAPVTSDLRHSELMNKFGGQQTSNVPQDLGASGAVSGNTTGPALPLDQATSKVAPGLGITAAEPQNPAVSGTDPVAHTINIAGKTYQLDNNGNPIGFHNPPTTFIQARKPGSDMTIHYGF